MAVAIFLAVPLVLMVGQGAATASVLRTAEMPTASAAVTLSVAEAMAADVQCGMVVTLDDGTFRVEAGGWCQVNVAPQPGCDVLNSDCTTLSLIAKSPDRSEEFGLDTTDADPSLYTNRATFGPQSWPFATESVVEVCIRVQHSTWGRQYNDVTGCAPVSLNAGFSTAECDVATIDDAFLRGPYLAWEGSGTFGLDSWWQEVEANFEMTFEEPSDWVMYVLVDQPVDGGYQSNLRRYGLVGWQQYPHTQNPMQGKFRVSDGWRPNWQEPEKPVYGNGLLGFGIFKRDGAASPQEFVQTPDKNPTYGRVGMTHAPSCAFYWGEPVFQSQGTNLATPIGPIPTGGAGPVDPPTAPVPPGDPVDEEGWWGLLRAILEKIASALSAIASAIGGLAKAVMDLLGGVLRGLFVPDQDKMEKAIEDAQFAWTHSSPVVYVKALRSVVQSMAIPAPASDCAGPQLSFTNPVGGSVVNVRPLSTCGSEMQVLSSLVRGILTITVYVGGVLVSARLVGKALGFDMGDLGRDDR